MFVIMVYDVNEKRVNKILKKSREFLTWIQNSVLEGEISESKFQKLSISIKKIIKEDEDSIIFYKLRDISYFSKDIIGLQKNKKEIFY
jgi:CRISPR-associated protein Cas2